VEPGVADLLLILAAAASRATDLLATRVATASSRFSCLRSSLDKLNDVCET
jgi:hypothetical protein